MTRTTAPSGFSLVELIVSVGLFSLVMLIATSAYYTLINLDRRARATNEVVNNLSFAVDAMARGIRTGSNYKCVATAGDSTSGNCTCFSYTDSNLLQTVSYGIRSDGTIGREKNGSSCLDANLVRITDPSIKINVATGLVFYVRGSASADNMQPQVLFTVKGTLPADNQGNTAAFNIEEDATQRLIDL
jgi:prepilin-type N-terminal cleavage/methylation domain-containing protein